MMKVIPLLYPWVYIYLLYVQV